MRHQLLTTAVAAVLGAAAVPGPAGAQTVPIEAELDSRIAHVEGLRAAGRCEEMRAALARLPGWLGDLPRTPVNDQIRAEAEGRIAQVRARPCPPPGVSEVSPGEMPDPSVDWPFGSVDPSAWLAAAYGAGKAEIPWTGIGFQRRGDHPERFGGMTARTLDLEVARFSLRRPIGGYDTIVALELGRGDADTWGQVQPFSGIVSGVVYGGLSPSGSSGVSVGERGSEFRTSTDLDYIDLQARVFAPPIEPLPRNVRLFGYLDVLHAERLYDAHYHYDGMAGAFVVDQTRRQSLDETYFGAGFGLMMGVPLGDRLTAYATGTAGAHHRRTELESWEHNTCNFCPAADRDFVIETRESDNGFSFATSASVVLEARVTDRVSFGVGGWARRLGSVGAVFNPNSGDQVFYEGLETGIETGEATTYGLGAGLRLRF